jgi:hypothetical protein
MKPERHAFAREAGNYIETEKGVVRDCFHIRPERKGMSLYKLWMELRRDLGPDVEVARNLDLDLAYIISARPDSKFTPDQIRKITFVYASIIAPLPVEQEGQVIKGPWPAQRTTETGESGQGGA